MKNIRLLFAFTKIGFQDHLTYKSALFIYMFEIFFVPLTLMFIWISMAATADNVKQNLQTITNYYLLLPVIILYTSAWHGRYLANQIRTGDINRYLPKPFPPLIHFIGTNLSSKLVKSTFLLPMVITASWFFPIKLSPSWNTIIVFTISLAFTWILTLLRDNVIGLLAFWLDDSSSIYEFFTISEFTLGGRFIPLMFFPPLIKSMANILPFRYFTSFPLEILTNSLTTSQIISGYLFQLFWLVIFCTINHILWSQGIKRYASYGG